jgi:hypothetical protein
LNIKKLVKKLKLPDNETMPKYKNTPNNTGTDISLRMSGIKIQKPREINKKDCFMVDKTLIY